MYGLQPANYVFVRLAIRQWRRTSSALKSTNSDDAAKALNKPEGAIVGDEEADRSLCSGSGPEDDGDAGCDRDAINR